ncbi:MAG: anion permease [Escherichia coli]|nr:anion permease [Escherichia coli]
MSLAKDNIWKLLAPLVVMGVMFLIPVPDGMPPQAWHYFAVFVAMIVGMILEPIPATAISFIAVTICVIGSNYLLFDAKELADPAFNAQKQALKWGLAGFSSTTVWLVFGAFIFALGYEVSGLGRRIALFLVKFMGKRTLTLGYAIVIIDILLAPFTPSNTARTGGTVFPVIKNLPPLFKSFPNDPSARRIGGYLMWMMVISTSLSSSMFVTGAAPNVLGLEFVSKIAGIQISWLQWFLCFLPVGVILLIIAPWLSYVLYKPEITHSEEVATWAGDELKTMGALTRREWTLIGLVLLSLGLWVFGSEVINATAVLFASLSAHTATMLPVILAVGKGIPGVPMEQLCILLVLSIGIMGCLTPYATGPGVIIYGCGYVKSKDYWRLGAIFGVIYISMLLLVGWPILAMWN